MTDWISFADKRPPLNEDVEIRYWFYSKIHEKNGYWNGKKVCIYPEEKGVANPVQWKHIDGEIN